MGTVGSLSKSATLVFWYISVGATFAFGALFLIAWLSEEFAKSEKWKARRSLLIVLAIIGVAGEELATLAEFMFSEHLQTIDDSEIDELTATLHGTFTKVQISILEPCLRNAVKGTVYIEPKWNDIPSEEYAERVRLILSKAGFDATLVPKSRQLPTFPNWRGLALFVSDLNAPPPDAAPILQCFHQAQIPCGAGKDKLYGLKGNELLIGAVAP